MTRDIKIAVALVSAAALLYVSSITVRKRPVLQKANELMLAGKFEEAADKFQEAKDNGAPAEECLYNIAQCQVQGGEPKKALKTCVELQLYSPYKVHVIRAAAYDLLGREVDARRERENAARYGDSIARRS